MSKARVYRVDDGATIRMVEANDSGQAKHHIGQVAATRAKDAVKDLRAARAIEIAEFVKGGGNIETAGVAPPVPVDGADRARQMFGGKPEQESAPPSLQLKPGVEPPPAEGC